MKWTKEEIQFLIDNYLQGVNYIAEYLNRPVGGVHKKAQALGISLGNRWLKEEEQFLVDNYTDKGVKYCAKKLNRSIGAVTTKASKLNLTKFIESWSESEVLFLVNNYSNNGPSYCAEKLNKKYESIKSKAGKLGLTKSKLDWAKDEIQFLINNYADKGPIYCAEKLNRTYDAVTRKASYLGLQANTIHSNSNILYAVYFPDLFLYKVGITNNIDRRVKEFGQPCVILKTQECEPTEAAELERKLLKSVTLINTGALNSGNTETFMQPSKEIELFLK
jgi:hypothetical protein